MRASRSKLIHALTEAGFKTQAALAERLAELEGLDAAPKDTVSRVFRELPVEFVTLERIARALAVDAYTLYLTSEDEARGNAGTDVRPALRLRYFWWLVALVFSLATIVAISWWGFGYRSADSTPATIGNDSDARKNSEPLGLGSTTLVVMTLDGDESGFLSGAIGDSLGKYFSVAARTASALTTELEPKAVAGRLRSEVVIDGEVVTVGRLTAVRVFLFARGARQQIWAESWPTPAIPDHVSDIAQHVSLATRRAMGIPIPAGELAHFPVKPVQDDYLEGELYLDRASSELNIKRAQSRFEAALRRDANYALAHAGLCETLLEEHWMSDEERALQDAAGACSQALQLSPDNPVVAAAHAHFLRLTGRNDEAIALYDETIARHPKDAAALLGLANSLLAAFRQSGDRDALIRAKEAARAAADVDETVWKPLLALATMEWFDGQLSAAIEVSEEALTRNRNEKILANLGSFYLCAGNFERARDTYLLAKKVNPQSYVGDEFLGQAFYFLGEFQKSAVFRQRAVDSIAMGEPEIHEMWGNLGDAYRQSGHEKEAVNAYRRAAEIAERDHLRGTSPAGDRAAMAYYYTVLNQLDAGSIPMHVMQGIREELDDIAEALNSTTGQRRMAQLYLLWDQTDKAKIALDRAMATCPGYGALPDLAGLQRH